MDEANGAFWSGGFGHLRGHGRLEVRAGKICRSNERTKGLLWSDGFGGDFSGLGEGLRQLRRVALRGLQRRGREACATSGGLSGLEFGFVAGEDAVNSLLVESRFSPKRSSWMSGARPALASRHHHHVENQIFCRGYLSAKPEDQFISGAETWLAHSKELATLPRWAPLGGGSKDAWKCYA
jgi:hypothetical protein